VQVTWEIMANPGSFSLQQRQQIHPLDCQCRFEIAFS
jgi:hypothetical protein